MKVEELIKNAMKDIMDARAEIVSNNIPVRTHFDVEEFKGNIVIVVQALPKRRLQPNSDFYEVELRLNSISRIQRDQKGYDQDLMYAECSDEIQEDLTKVTLQAAIDAIDAASGITIDGHVPQEGGFSNEEEDSIQYESTLIFLTYNAP